MVLLLGDASWRRRAVAAAVGVALWAVLVAAFAYTKAPYGREEFDPARIEAFGAAARRALVFDAKQDAWCNTLVSVNPPYFYPEMVTLPPGLGVTLLFGTGGARRPALRLRYVLLDPDHPRRWSLGAPDVTHVGPDHVRVTVAGWPSLDLRPLASTPVGQLYQNLDAHCPG
jgi:hypothetical protein